MKSMKHQLLLVFVSLFFSIVVSAQDARFSQVGTAPVQFNPALTGRFDGKIRFGGLYSGQKTLNFAMQHQNISLDAKFGKYKSSGDENVLKITDLPGNNKKIKEGKRLLNMVFGGLFTRDLKIPVSFQHTQATGSS